MNLSKTEIMTNVDDHRNIGNIAIERVYLGHNLELGVKQSNADKALYGEKSTVTKSVCFISAPVVDERILE